MTQFNDYDQGFYSFFQEHRQRQFRMAVSRGRAAGVMESYPQDARGGKGIGALITTDAKSQIETNESENPQNGALILGSETGVLPDSFERKKLPEWGA